MALAILFLLGLPALTVSVTAEASSHGLRTDATHVAAESLLVRTERVEQLASVEREALAAQQGVINELVSRETLLLKQEADLDKEQKEMSQQLGQLRGSSLFRLDKEIELEKLSIAQKLASGLIWIVFAIISGWIYGYVFTYEYPALKNPAAAEPELVGFRNGLFTGFRCDPDWRICLCSLICMHARWADTVSSLKVSFMEFWYALLLFSVTMCAPFAVASYGATIVLWLVVVVKARQKIRQVYNMPNGTCGSYISDCCVWLVCPWCAAMQEALEVEFVEPNENRKLMNMENVAGQAFNSSLAPMKTGSQAPSRGGRSGPPTPK
jgi:Cys-rich protein (TIGR01571 family)